MTAQVSKKALWQEKYISMKFPFLLKERYIVVEHSPYKEQYYNVKSHWKVQSRNFTSEQGLESLFFVLLHVLSNHFDNEQTCSQSVCQGPTDKQE